MKCIPNLYLWIKHKLMHVKPGGLHSRDKSIPASASICGYLHPSSTQLLELLRSYTTAVETDAEILQVNVWVSSKIAEVIFQTA